MSLEQLPRPIAPTFGKIYRTRRRESVLVLGVRPERICIEYADGRVQRLSPDEWYKLEPVPARY